MLVFLEKTPAHVLSQAESWLKRHSSAQPRFDKLRSQSLMGVAQYRLGKFDEAIKQLEESIRLRGESAGEERFVLPMALQAAGREREAKQAFDIAEQWREETIPYDPSFSLIREEAAKALGIVAPAIAKPPIQPSQTAPARKTSTG